jgi:hypothetical protein
VPDYDRLFDSSIARERVHLGIFHAFYQQLCPLVVHLSGPVPALGEAFPSQGRVQRPATPSRHRASRFTSPRSTWKTSRTTHSTMAGTRFVHKLRFGGYSTVWLARDKDLQRYVSLKILVAHESLKSNEASILRLLSSRGDSTHQGQQFIPLLLGQFSFDGPNGRHTCLVQEPAGCSIAASKEDSTNFLFPVETARSTAAQLIMGVAYLHFHGVCHGGILTQPPSLRSEP